MSKIETLEAQILEALKDRAGDVAAISIRIGDLSISDSRIRRAAQKLVDRGTLERSEYTELESRKWLQAGRLQRRRVEYRIT